jgi:hypothetical protein
MTFEEMVQHLLETYPSDRYRDDELMNHITEEVNAVEARGEITADVRDRIYHYFAVTTQRHGGPG